MAQTDNEKNKEPKQEAYLGDLEKTNIIQQLVQTPRKDRDANWRNTFLQNVGQASFRCGEPQVINGPDGFPYFQLFLPEPNKSFNCYVIDRIKDDFLLKSGIGVVINPTANSADYVFSYGDILNFHLNKTYYATGETSFSKGVKDETIPEDNKVMISQPSETILPKETRALLSKVLKSKGIEIPKVLLMSRPRQDGKGVSQDIVFNLTPASFENENIYKNVMRTISWFLPRHYAFMGMDEKAYENGFMELE